MFSKNEIPKDFLAQHEEIMRYFEQNYVINMNKLKFYNEHPEDSHTERWERIHRLIPNKFIQKFNIENIPSEKKLIPQTTNTKLCSKMQKLSVDCRFNTNEDCNLAVATLQTFTDQAYSEQLLSIFEKFQNTQDLLTWPYDTEDKTITNLPAVDLALEYGKPVERVRKTMFVTPLNLYGFVAKFEEIYDLFVVQHFPQDEIVCTFDAKVSVKYKFTENYGKSEREFLVKVFGKWMELKPKKIIFKNVLFLTHFSASFLRILASFYKFFSVNLKGTVELEHFKDELIRSKPEFVKEFADELNGSSSNYIMFFAELKHVNKGEYFEIISNYNSQLIMQYILKTFDYLISKEM